ncbi:phage tail family protein [Oceanobacillus sojae]|uniref:phage tail family protein n=1 Tax=Oceanobacillus sojae TaxID=582851 RepID=UPI00098886AB|nr:phage tail family protein [Oceanobacillus sojae]
MFKLMFTNAIDQTVELFDHPYRLIRVEGIGDTEATTQMQKVPFQDGASYIGSILEDKPIEIELKITGDNEQDLNAKRRYFASVFNPKLGVGTLRYISGGDVKEIDAVAESVPNFPDGQTNRKPLFQKALLYIRAPYPYWRDPNQTSQPLQAYSGNLTMPNTFPIEMGRSGSHTTLYNSGDIPAPVRIDIQGPVANPQIINRTNGDWLRVNRSIAADEILHIDTTNGKKRVEVYRNGRVFNVFGYIDHDSDWLQLDVGENLIEHIADSGDTSGMVAVTWNNQYVGI